MIKNRAMGDDNSKLKPGGGTTSFVNHVGGTQLYMAPELFRSGKVRNIQKTIPIFVEVNENLSLQNSLPRHAMSMRTVWYFWKLLSLPNLLNV